MEKNIPPVVKRSLFSWIFSGNVKLQILLVFIILIMIFARVLPLEMQKRIINEAINLRKLDLLFLYCGIYLVHPSQQPDAPDKGYGEPVREGDDLAEELSDE